MWVLEKGEDRNQKESSNFVCWCAYYQNKWFPPISSNMKEEIGEGGGQLLLYDISFEFQGQQGGRKKGNKVIQCHLPKSYILKYSNYKLEQNYSTNLLLFMLKL